MNIHENLGGVGVPVSTNLYVPANYAGNYGNICVIRFNSNRPSSQLLPIRVPPAPSSNLVNQINIGYQMIEEEFTYFHQIDGNLVVGVINSSSIPALEAVASGQLKTVTVREGDR